MLHLEPHIFFIFLRMETTTASVYPSNDVRGLCEIAVAEYSSNACNSYRLASAFGFEEGSKELASLIEDINLALPESKTKLMEYDEWSNTVDKIAETNYIQR